MSDGAATAAFERAGVYEVHAEHSDYLPWVREEVRVTEDQCHLRTQEPTARLQPR